MRKGVFSLGTRMVSIILVVSLVGMSLYAVGSFLSVMSASKRTATSVMEAHRILEDLVERGYCLAYVPPASGSSPGGPNTDPGVIDLGKIVEFERRYKDREPECAPSFLGDYRVTIIENSTPVGLEDLSTADAVIVFVIDSSGSMGGSCTGCGGKSRLDVVKEVTSKFIDNVTQMEAELSSTHGRSISIMVGAVDFDSSASVIHNPDLNRGAVKTAINSLAANGGTCIGDGIGKATSTMIPISSPVKHIILLSDGCSSCGEDNPVGQASSAHSQGMIVHTIYFQDTGSGAGTCPATMQEIATNGGGGYYPIDDPVQLENALEEIRQDIENHISSTSPPPKQTVTGSYKEWSFGVDSFSPPGLVYTNVTVKMPVPIRDGDYERRGVIVVTLVDGELERLANLVGSYCHSIERAMMSGSVSTIESVRARIKLSRPVVFDQSTGLLCYSGTTYCKNVSCEARVTVPPWGLLVYPVSVDIKSPLEKGSYYVTLSYSEPSGGLSPGVPGGGGTITLE